MCRIEPVEPVTYQPPQRCEKGLRSSVKYCPNPDAVAPSGSGNTLRIKVPGTPGFREIRDTPNS